jgi:hypothetical protein
MNVLRRDEPPWVEHNETAAGAESERIEAGGAIPGDVGRTPEVGQNRRREMKQLFQIGLGRCVDSSA